MRAARLLASLALVIFLERAAEGWVAPARLVGRARAARRPPSRVARAASNTKRRKAKDAAPPKDAPAAEKYSEPCNVVLTHTNADFDSLAAAVALAKLWSVTRPGLPTHVVLPRNAHPVVGRFLAFHKHLLPLRGFKTIEAADLHALGVVDARRVARIGRGAEWLAHARSVHVYDHHCAAEPAAPAGSSAQWWS